MKSNWTTLEERVIQSDKERVCEWLEKFIKSSQSAEEYLENDSDEYWLHEIIADIERKGEIKIWK